MKSPLFSFLTLLRNGNGGGMKLAACSALWCAFAAVPNLQATEILQADFNGSGTGTGGVSDVVTFGGTGSIYQYTSATTSVESAPTLGQGDFLKVSVPSATATTPSNGMIGGALLTPASSAHSFAAMNTIGGGATGTTLHGALDFFIREDTIAPLSAAIGNIIDLGSQTGGAIRVILQINATSIRFRLYSATGISGGEGFLTGASYTTPNENAIIDANLTLVAGATYHLGYTMNTDSVTGVSTMNVFERADGGAIDTTSTADRIGTTSFKINGTNVTTGLSSSAFQFNIGGNSSSQDAAGRQVSADALRLYDAVPTSFASVPEPGAVSLVGVGLLGLLAACGRKKQRA